MSSRRVVLSRTGGPEVLEVVDGAEPTPGAGQLVVAVETAGVAFAEVLMRRGRYPEAPRLPFTPGYDVCGRVVAAGSGVSADHVGTRVVGLTVTGGYAEHALVDERFTVPVPDDLDAATAVSLVLNYTTAQQMLHRVAGAQAGQTVLVHGAAGGVGTAMLQLCGLAGVSAWGTASAGKHDLVSSLGGHPLDYRAPDALAPLREALPAGVDATFDPIGGKHLSSSVAITRRGGHVVSYGISSSTGSSHGRLALAGHVARLGAATVLPNGRTVSLYVIAGKRGFATKHPDWFRDDLSTLVGLATDGRISPVVAEVVPLDEVSRAHELLESAAVTGKLVLRVG